MDIFTTTATTTGRASRFTPLEGGASVPTTLTRDDGEIIAGRVYIGKDRAKLPHLVHNVNGAEVACPMYVIATALASGKIVPVDAIAAAFASTGKLAALKRAVDKAAAPE